MKRTIAADLREKMVFVGGPRQVGKTTLALSFLHPPTENHPAYLNWDAPQSRRMLLSGALPGDEPLVLLDEIHKYKQWRNLVKGLYDTNKSSRQFLITGSASLDYYRRGGDSLQGRYHYYRLHPFSFQEATPGGNLAEVERLLKFGGFPEPLFKAEEKHWKRWQSEHRSRVIHEDLVTLENVKEVSQLDLLAGILPERVGSPLSINNLRQDLSVAFETADRWIGILERLYYCFRIAPHGFPKLRTAVKENKLYMWDWSVCPRPAARFENMIASHLLKYCHYVEDTTGDRMDLQFIRDASRREIDFLIVRDGKPLFAVECKTGERGLSGNIAYFSRRTAIPKFYQVHMGDADFEVPDCRARVIPFNKWTEILGV